MTVTVFRLNGVDYSDAPKAVIDALTVAVSRLADVEALIDHARKISPSERAVVYVADLERALGMDAPRPHKIGGNG